MCDTLCALPGSTKDGYTLLAKNSDRSPNEPHLLRFVPARRHAPNSAVPCTYVSIPQAERTYAALLFKPDWIWGAEMGVNEHGVAIGNEAVFTKAKKGPDALLGMDLLRLGLERAKTAEEAVSVIAALLETYGQGGNCGYDHDFRYDNSFLIADPDRAFILETAGRDWAAAEIKEKGAISNGLSLHTEHTLRRGVAAGEDFALKYREPVYTFFSASKARRAQSVCALHAGPQDPAAMMRALRSHPTELEGREFTRGAVKSVCMHAGGLIGDHTTGSFVAVLRKNAPMTIWATGASTPCLSAFKPLFFGVESGAPVFNDEAEGRAYWLRRERLHRAVLAGRADAAELRKRRDTLEEKWLDEEARIFASGVPDERVLLEFSARAAAEEEALIGSFPVEGWETPNARGQYGRYWKAKNVALGKPRSESLHR
ncbi:MAG TPA: C69 family dipeptidase [Feifaniaceae bacterium]|nr:C69 family dipeptidase [Feifaniaceae bacterium]